jgi:hypothetical protein
MRTAPVWVTAFMVLALLVAVSGAAMAAALVGAPRVLTGAAAGKVAETDEEIIIDVPPDRPGGPLPVTGVTYIGLGWVGWLLLGVGAIVRRQMRRSA